MRRKHYQKTGILEYWKNILIYTKIIIFQFYPGEKIKMKKIKMKKIKMKKIKNKVMLKSTGGW